MRPQLTFHGAQQPILKPFDVMVLVFVTGSFECFEPKIIFGKVAFSSTFVGRRRATVYSASRRSEGHDANQGEAF